MMLINRKSINAKNYIIPRGRYRPEGRTIGTFLDGKKILLSYFRFMLWHCCVQNEHFTHMKITSQEAITCVFQSVSHGQI